MYGRRIDDTIYSFGHEGVLYRQSFVMYDRETESLWIHTTGEAVRGPAKGKVLTFLPSTVTTWRKWKALNPDTTVLTGARARGGMGRFGFAENPERYGFSIGQGPSPKLYPFADLARQRVVNDVHDGLAVLVVYDADSGTARAYERGERRFVWKDECLVDADGRAWDLLGGVPREAGIDQRLTPVPGTVWLVERWRGFHPRAPVYGAD